MYIHTEYKKHICFDNWGMTKLNLIVIFRFSTLSNKIIVQYQIDLM